MTDAVTNAAMTAYAKVGETGATRLVSVTYYKRRAARLGPFEALARRHVLQLNLTGTNHS
jgi:hypothetical protein